MGHFEEERDRLRAKMRADFPTVAALVDKLRAHRCAVEVSYASENGNERGDPNYFARLVAAADSPESRELEAVFNQAHADQAALTRSRRRST